MHVVECVSSMGWMEHGRATSLVLPQIIDRSCVSAVAMHPRLSCSLHSGLLHCFPLFHRQNCRYACLCLCGLTWNNTFLSLWSVWSCGRQRRSVECTYVFSCSLYYLFIIHGSKLFEAKAVVESSERFNKGFNI